MAVFRRAGILVALILFVVASLSTTGFVLYEMYKEGKNNKLASEVTETTPAEQTNEPQEGMLQGTKLENFEPVAKVEKLEIIDLQEGTGEVVKPGDTVTAHYTGALAKDGTIFQSSHDMGRPIPFGLNQVIKGWTDGVPGMKVGGKRRLLIPADQAYGPQAQNGIPANSDLVFDIELVKIGE